MPKNKKIEYYKSTDSTSINDCYVSIEADHGESFGNPSLLADMENFLETKGHERLIKTINPILAKEVIRKEIDKSKENSKE